MTLIEHAQYELRNEDPMMREAIMEVVEIFANQGHSGASAAYALDRIKKLLNYHPISPLTGEDDEWNESRPGVFQNKRYPALFKRGGLYKDVDAATFYVPGEEGYFTNGKLIQDYARAHPITMPYTPPNDPVKVRCGRDKEGNAYIEDL